MEDLSFPEFQILTVNNSDENSQLTFENQSVDKKYYHIAWLKRGNLSLTINALEPLLLEEHSIMFFYQKPDILFNANNSDFELKIYCFTDDFFCKTSFDIQFLDGFILLKSIEFPLSNPIQVADCAIFDLFRLIEEEYDKTDAYSQGHIIKNYLHNIMLLIDREEKPVSITELTLDAHLDIFLQFKNLLEKYFREEKRVAEYARKIGVREKSLIQITAKITGKFPKEIIRERVLLEARRLLRYSNKSIKEIGFELGFNETTNFIKYFRLYNRYTPMEFRNFVREKE